MADNNDVLSILEEHFGKVKVKGNYAYIQSPFNFNDKTPSCAVVLTKSEKFSEGFFKDFSTGRSGNIFSLLNIPHDYGLKERRNNLPSLNSPVTVRHHMSKFEYSPSPYLYSKRGIPYEVQEQFKVFEMDGHVSMPVFDRDGYFIYNVSRLTDVKGYALSVPTDAYPALTHTLNTSDTVFVCESMIDAFTFFTNGLKAISLNGAGNHSMLKEVFKNHFGRIVLALDPDEVGQTNALYIKNNLIDKDVVNIELPFDVNETWTRMLGDLGFDTAKVVFLKLIERKINNKKCPCCDCNKETKNTRDYYMVRDEIWYFAVPEENGCGVIFLCRDCLSKRLGRPLEDSDFIESETNNYSETSE